MKVESIIFANGIAEVRLDRDRVRVDFGVVVMELTTWEAASLVGNLLQIEQVQRMVSGKLLEGR